MCMHSNAFVHTHLHNHEISIHTLKGSLVYTCMLIQTSMHMSTHAHTLPSLFFEPIYPVYELSCPPRKGGSRLGLQNEEETTSPKMTFFPTGTGAFPLA